MWIIILTIGHSKNLCKVSLKTQKYQSHSAWPSVSSTDSPPLVTKRDLWVLSYRKLVITRINWSQCNTSQNWPSMPRVVNINKHRQTCGSEQTVNFLCTTRCSWDVISKRLFIQKAVQLCVCGGGGYFRSFPNKNYISKICKQKCVKHSGQSSKQICEGWFP